MVVMKQKIFYKYGLFKALLTGEEARSYFLYLLRESNFKI